MEKKRVFFVVLVLLGLLLCSSCSNKNKVDINQIKISEEIGVLKEKISNNPSDKGLRKEIARKYFELDLEKAKAEGVTAGNEPFYLESNGTIGVVLIHGFSASPYEVEGLGKSLNERGITVYGVRLAGHGADYRDFGKYTYNDWINSTDNGLAAIKYSSDKVFVGGVSLGGDIALDIAKRENLSGVILISAPVKFLDDSTKYAYIARWFLNTLPNEKLKEADKKYYYKDRSLEAIYQLNEYLNNDVLKDLDKIEEPILIMQSVNDITVDYKSAEILYNMTNSSRKKVLIPYVASSHVIVNDMEREKLFNDVYKFIVEADK